MSTADAWTYAANDGGRRQDDGWSQRTRYGFSDIVTLLWRQRWLMAGIFVAITALGLAYALTLKTQYTANASLLVKLGQEYVYQPRAGDAGRGAVPNNDAVVASEVDILQSSALHQRVIERIGLANIYPKLNAGRTAEEKTAAMAKAVATMDKALTIATAPDLPDVHLSFKHDNPEMAARVLNTLMDEYQVYRRAILLNSNEGAIQTQKAATEQELAADDAAYQAFLTFNHIGDFDGEKAALTQVLSSSEQQRYTLESSLQDAQAALTSTTGQLAATPPEVTSYRDVNLAGTQNLDTLRQQRAQLLQIWSETSDIVKAKEQEIQLAEKAQGQAAAPGDTARRVGANPVRQTLESDHNSAQQRVASLTASLAKVNAQITEVNQRLLDLAQLEPQYRLLANQRNVDQDSVTDFARREQESTASDAIAQNGPDNIRVVSRATAPVQGSSTRKLVAIMAIVLAAFTALCVGLLNVFLQPGLPTAVAAGRTLDLPVLATARMKR